MKTIVFAYHDMGCTGITALLRAGYSIAAIFTHADATSEESFLWLGRPAGSGKRHSGLRPG